MREIRTQDDFETLVSQINWTDAFLRECYIVSPAFLLRDKTDSKVLQTSGSGGLTVRMLVLLGSDRNTASVEFVFEQVGQISVTAGMQMDLSCAIDTWQKTVYFTRDQRQYITGRCLWYELLDEKTWGPRLRYGSHMPDENAIEAVGIDDGWRQCTECKDAWEESPHEVFSICPSCLRMTQLRTKHKGE